jgi:UDP-2,4-diacetamido-2,4,6-trideoxy-beta-L-altropyranose hydrolase
MIHFRKAHLNDLITYFDWVSDDSVVENSISKVKITLEEHTKWFKKSIENHEKFMLIFFENKTPIGQVRIENQNKENVVDISIDRKFRGKKIGSTILKSSCIEFLKNNPTSLTAYILKENIASKKSFEAIGFKFESESEKNGRVFLKFILPQPQIIT